VSLALLALSLAALAIGPLTAAVFRKTRWSADLLDGLVLVAVSGLVLVHVLPHTVAVAGWTAIAVAAGGFALPFVPERWGRGSRRTIGSSRSRWSCIDCRTAWPSGRW
jgi:hypothetical protein